MGLGIKNDVMENRFTSYGASQSEGHV